MPQTRDADARTVRTLLADIGIAVGAPRGTLPLDWRKVVESVSAQYPQVERIAVSMALWRAMVVAAETASYRSPEKNIHVWIADQERRNDCGAFRRIAEEAQRYIGDLGIPGQQMMRSVQVTTSGTGRVVQIQVGEFAPNTHRAVCNLNQYVTVAVSQDVAASVFVAVHASQIRQPRIRQLVERLGGRGTFDDATALLCTDQPGPIKTELTGEAARSTPFEIDLLRAELANGQLNSFALDLDPRGAQPAFV